MDDQTKNESIAVLITDAECTMITSIQPMQNEIKEVNVLSSETLSLTAPLQTTRTPYEAPSRDIYVRQTTPTQEAMNYNPVPVYQHPKCDYVYQQSDYENQAPVKLTIEEAMSRDPYWKSRSPSSGKSAIDEFRKCFNPTQPQAKNTEYENGFKTG